MAVTAVALLLVAAALYAATTWLPQLTQSPDQPQAAEDTNQSPPRQRQDESPSPAPNQPAEPQPQPDDSGEQPKPEPKPEDPIEQPKPEPKPDDTIEQPKPEPKRDDTVEQPKPEPKPDDTVEQPKPESKPEDTIEQPKQPEGTTSEPKAERTIQLLRASRNASLQYAADTRIDTDRPTFVDAAERQEFGNKSWLSCREAVDIDTAGVLLRLNGVARIEIGHDHVQVRLTEDDVFLDNRGSLHAVTVFLGESHIHTAEGSQVLIQRRVSGIEFSVFSGDVLVPSPIGSNQHVMAGKRGTIKGAGRLVVRDLVGQLEDEPFLEGIVERIAYGEDFSASKPSGRLREGEIKDGVLTGPTVFWGYPDDLRHEAGLVLRLRVRFTGATGATVTQFAVPRNDNFSLDLTAEQIKEGWQTLELKVDEFLERTTHKEHPNEVDWFQNISIQLQGENAQVELDWVELIRAVE